MARKTIARAGATLAIAPELLEKLLPWCEVRSVEGGPLTVFSLGCEKADSPICIYDHRLEVSRAAARFEEDPSEENAQTLIDAFSADALVRIVTSRIGAVDRPAINFHPLEGSRSIDHVFSGTLQTSPVVLPELDQWSARFPAGRKGKITFALRRLPPPAEPEDHGVDTDPNAEMSLEPPEDLYALMGIKTVVFDRRRPRKP